MANARQSSRLDPPTGRWLSRIGPLRQSISKSLQTTQLHLPYVSWDSSQYVYAAFKDLGMIYFMHLQFWIGGLVAQSSATGVTVAAIPPCSAIRFRNPKVPRYPPPARRAPCLLRMRGKCDRGVRRKVRHLDLGGCSAILARHV